MKGIRKTKIGKLVLTLTIAAVLFAAVPKEARAEVWGSNLMAVIWERTMRKIDQIKDDTLLGILKSAAIQSLHGNVDRLLTGQSGEELFITDWEDFLRAGPRNRTVVYMNDFFGSVYEGRDSGFYVPYDSVNGEPGVAGVNYARDLQKIARAAAGMSNDIQRSRYDLDRYVNDPSQIFAYGSTGGWRAFDALMSNPWNNPYGTALMSQEQAMARMEIEREISQSQSIAYQGFRARTSGGRILAPGSVLANVKYSIDKAAMDMYTNAQSPWEIVIYSMVDMLITKLFNEGVGGAITDTMRNVVIPTNNAVQNINREIQTSGPQTRYQPSY